MNKEDGGQAFPTIETLLMRDHSREPNRFTYDATSTPGMTLRDWFAGQELAGIGASDPDWVGTPEQIAARAYRVADAMLKAREA